MWNVHVKIWNNEQIFEEMISIHLSLSERSDDFQGVFHFYLTNGSTRKGRFIPLEGP